MFAVPKDTKLLAFTINFADTITPERIAGLEARLTQKTGIPCVVLDQILRHGEDGADFLTCDKDPSLEQAQNEADEARPVLNKQPEYECDDGGNYLGDRSPRRPLRSTFLRFLKGFILLAAGVVLGLPLGYALGLLLISK